MINKIEMNKFILLMLFLTSCFCERRNETAVADDYKCSLPDVTSVDDNLDISRFRSDFSKISEVKFPGLMGPLNERLVCKIKCVDGNWVGPLCSPTSDGRFQPVLRECLYRNRNPLLAAAFNNDSIAADTYFPHGAVIAVRCKHFGLYKLTGDNALRCDNGRWSSRAPQCVPTAAVTNYTEGSPPALSFAAAAGSAALAPGGELLVFPGSTLWLDCLWPRARGPPAWSWARAARHRAAWAGGAGEAALRYRLVLARVSARHADRYTCTAPAGGTHSVTVRVASVVCPPINVTSPHARYFAQGSRLGHAVHFSCGPGYRLDGPAVISCMGDGRWSARPPACAERLCPGLGAAGAHLTLLEYDPSPGGRAVFACAWGYRLAGAPGLECEPDGRWSADVPRCVPIYCPEPPVPARGRLVAAGERPVAAGERAVAASERPVAARARGGRRPVGALAAYACETGYEVVGEASIVCTESGFWSHPPPFCLPPSRSRPAHTIYVDNTTLVNFEE